MRIILLSCLFAVLATPVFAKDSGDAAFDLLAEYTAESQQTDYIKLQSTIPLSDAKSIDVRMTELYGEPNFTRTGLKVWEVENKKGIGAPHATIMCGPDGKGGIFISADRRGPTPNGAANRNRRQTVQKAQPQSKRLKPKLPQSQERD